MSMGSHLIDVQGHRLDTRFLGDGAGGKARPGAGADGYLAAKVRQLEVGLAAAAAAAVLYTNSGVQSGVLADIYLLAVAIGPSLGREGVGKDADFSGECVHGKSPLCLDY